MDGISIAWLVLAVLGLVAFAAITVELLNHVVWPFDQSRSSTQSGRGSATARSGVSCPSRRTIPLIVIGVGMVLVLFFTHRRREAVLVAVALIAITAGSEGMKQLVARPRPEGTDPNIPGVVYSYPSGHVLEALDLRVIAIHVSAATAARRSRRSSCSRSIADALLRRTVSGRVGRPLAERRDVLTFAGAGVLGIYGLLTHGDAWATKRSDRHGPRAGRRGGRTTTRRVRGLSRHARPDADRPL